MPFLNGGNIQGSCGVCGCNVAKNNERRCSFRWQNTVTSSVGNLAGKIPHLPRTVNSYVKVEGFFSHILTNGTLGLTIINISFNAGAPSTRPDRHTGPADSRYGSPGGRRTGIEQNIRNSQAKRSVSKDMAEEPSDFHETIDSGRWGFFPARLPIELATVFCHRKEHRRSLFLQRCIRTLHRCLVCFHNSSCNW